MTRAGDAVKALSKEEALMLLDWYDAMGVDECISDQAQDRFSASTRSASHQTAEARLSASQTTVRQPHHEKPRAVSVAAPVQPHSADWQMMVRQAEQEAMAAQDLEALSQAVVHFDGGLDRRMCKEAVFGSGPPDADIMLVVKGPTDARDDQTGVPFAGDAGILLDRMLAAIGLDRSQHCRIATLVPWYALGGRDHSNETHQIFAPFLRRHIALVAPKIILSLGSIPSKILLGKEDGLAALRKKQHNLGEGNGHTVTVFTTHHPAALVKSPALKGQAWTDLQRFRDAMHRLAGNG